MYKERWNEICFLLSDNIQKETSEDEFEKCVIQALRVLEWKQYLGDFDVRPTFQIGASNKITPDFVIKSKDGITLFVIEIKQPNIPLNTSFQKQLFSYMRQLKSEFGILIGQAIQIFYDGTKSNQADPLMLETIKFERNSSKGEKFVNLFSKENFNVQALDDLVSEVIQKMNRKEEYKTLMKTVLSSEFNDKLKGLIKSEFLSEYDGEVIDSMLEDIMVTISNNKREIIQPVYSAPYRKISSRPGVIDSIMNAIAKEPKSHDQILNELIQLFPDRNPSSMMNTITAQLGGTNPLRMEREKKIHIHISYGRDNVKRYLATGYTDDSTIKKNLNSINSYIKDYYDKTPEEFAQYLAEKYITDSYQKEVFLRNGVRMNVRLNYIAGLILLQKGKEIFTPKDIRDIVKNELIPSLKKVIDTDFLSGRLLTSDMHIEAKDPKYHNGYPCLEKAGKGKYRFIGFS